MASAASEEPLLTRPQGPTCSQLWEPGTGSSAKVPGTGWHRAQPLLLHRVKRGQYWLLAGA